MAWNQSFIQYQHLQEVLFICLMLKLTDQLGMTRKRMTLQQLYGSIHRTSIPDFGIEMTCEKSLTNQQTNQLYGESYRPTSNFVFKGIKNKNDVGFYAYLRHFQKDTSFLSISCKILGSLIVILPV